MSGPARGRWRTHLRGLAVEIGRAASLEREAHRREARIEAVHRRVGLTALIVELHEAQPVLGRVARLGDLDLEIVIQCRVGLPVHPHIDRADVADSRGRR